MMMFIQELENLPARPVNGILILRTAPTPQVQWAIERLRERYPAARLSILGRQLDQNSLFEGMRKFELPGQWLNPRTFRPVRKRVCSEAFDLVVVCLNSDHGAGYENVSRVVEQIPAQRKLLAGYDQRWYEWNPKLFVQQSLLFRWILNGLELLLCPAMAACLLFMTSGPRYMPAGQERPSPGYDR